MLAIFKQDMRSRAVYWYWFPILTILFLVQGIKQKPFPEILATSAMNIGFVLLQLLLISVYFSIKNKRAVNITHSLLGWGDILFLLCIATYLSTINYILFYILSLVIVIIMTGIYLLFHKKAEQIPLAGLQAMIFIVCLILDWLSPRIDLIHDDWLTPYLL
ncbi:hypothetical protein [Mucilaginibacter gracilis]|uniref:hypothetical protein n=1 Tax=Mucilaginibacter gracilis TaxID=423350 RepID=UPI0011C49599|nr:hypothetical protein [Mucilaginibacter gracilis]